MRVAYLLVVAALVVLLGALEVVAARNVATVHPAPDPSYAPSYSTPYWK